jgi:hypothetical protein
VYKPPSLLSPGDIFPAVPCSFLSSPLKISRKCPYTPPSERGPQEFRRIYSHPSDTGQLNPAVAIDSQAGEECLSVVRIGRAILLTYECTVDADIKARQQSGPKRGRIWHIAPIFDLANVPSDARIQDETTGDTVLMRDVVRGNISANYFFLEPLPGASDNAGHYIDFRKLAPASVEYVLAEEGNRLVTLDDKALNGCLAQLMWFFTRAKYLHEPVQCQNCGHQMDLAVELAGQELNIDRFQT